MLIVVRVSLIVRCMYETNFNRDSDYFRWFGCQRGIQKHPGLVGQLVSSEVKNR